MTKPWFTLSILLSMFSLCVEVSGQVQTRETKAGSASIPGRVVFKGEPARNLPVCLLQPADPWPSNPDAYLRARTGENGHFRITGVAAGSYVVVALAPGFISADTTNPSLAVKTINVSEGENIENIEIELKQGSVITGRVTDSQGRPIVEEGVTLT